MRKPAAQALVRTLISSVGLGGGAPQSRALLLQNVQVGIARLIRGKVLLPDGIVTVENLGVKTAFQQEDESKIANGTHVICSFAGISILKMILGSQPVCSREAHSPLNAPW
jgi:hypothetical protein